MKDSLAMIKPALRKIKRYSSEIIAISTFFALIISAFSIMYLAYNNYSQVELQKEILDNQTMPLLYFVTDSAGLLLVNAGLGPAIVESVRIFEGGLLKYEMEKPGPRPKEDVQEEIDILTGVSKKYYRFDQSDSYGISELKISVSTHVPRPSLVLSPGKSTTYSKSRM